MIITPLHLITFLLLHEIRALNLSNPSTNGVLAIVNLSKILYSEFLTHGALITQPSFLY